jgi:homoserine dehydrogenase
MKTKKKVVIVGQGKVGTHLAGRLEAWGFEVSFFTRQDGDLKKFEELLDRVKPKGVFVTINTKDKGQAAFGYIEACTICDVPVITCEKDSPAYHPEIFKKNPGLIAYSAAVGGGTQLLNYVQSRFWYDQKVEVHAVLNGSLNFFFEAIAQGKNCEQAYEEVWLLDSAESGSTDPLSLVNNERRDLYMKTAAFFNMLIADDSFITPEYLKGYGDLDQTGLKKITEGGDHYRFIVSFLSHRGPNNDQWEVRVAPRKINDNPLYSWLPSGIENGIRIIEGEKGIGGNYTLIGDGAGLVPTTSAMLADFKRLCFL